MSGRVLLSVDFSYQVYRAAASHPDLMCMSTETFTGGLYGFMQSFSKTVRETQATDVVVCLDSKPYLRSRDYPAYKQLRKKGADDDLLRLYQASEPLVLDLLQTMGVPVWAEPGFESDDLTAALVQTQRSRYRSIYAASNDSDLYQLLNRPQFAVYRDSIANVVTAERLLASSGLTPAEFMLSTALQGTHNDIEGILGVGPKTAAKAVKDPAVMRKYRDSHGDVIDRNLALIKLPHHELPRSAAPPTRGGGFSARELYRWCSTYDIDCTLSMVNAFEQIAKS